jgi:tRNA pseudouridine65 synthase
VCLIVLQILYKDHHYAAINKPAGLLVHRSPIDRHETRFAVQLLRDQLGQRVYPVHRLDKPTSGVLIFGLHSDAAQQLARQFEAREVQKHYIAVVRGHIRHTITIDHPLTQRDDKYEESGNDVGRAAQPATTAIDPIADIELPLAFGRYASMRLGLVKATPGTGRKHQIRRHLKHISHPIIGDANYGKGDLNRFFAAQFNCSRLLLAATRLEFMHPFNNSHTVIDAPIDTCFQQLVDRFGWGNHLPITWHGDLS